MEETIIGDAENEGNIRKAQEPSEPENNPVNQSRKIMFAPQHGTPDFRHIFTYLKICIFLWILTNYFTD